MVPIFIVLTVIVFRPIKSAFNLGKFPSSILSVCVSALCVIGMNHLLKGSIEWILLPYAAMAVAILLILLFSFIDKFLKRTKDRPKKRCTKYCSETDDSKFKR